MCFKNYVTKFENILISSTPIIVQKNCKAVVISYHRTLYNVSIYMYVYDTGPYTFELYNK